MINPLILNEIKKPDPIITCEDKKRKFSHAFSPTKLNSKKQAQDKFVVPELKFAGLEVFTEF